MTESAPEKPPSTSPPDVSIRALLALAVPSVVFAVLTNAYRAVDQFWIQDVSTEAQAAIGSSVFVLILFNGFFYLVAGGVGPVVARAVGAGDQTMLREAIGGSISGGVVIAALTALGGGLGAPWIASSMGLSGQTAVECAIYIETIAWTVLPLVLTPIVDQSFIAMGEAKVPMVLHAVSLGLNAILTPLLIFDAELGIAGAALASNGSRAVSTGIALWLLWRRAGLSGRDLRAWSALGRVVKIGVPVSVGVATYTLVYWGMLVTSISPLGPHINAGLGIGFSALEGSIFPCFHGVSLAVASFVGRALGAGRPDLAYTVLKKALPVSLALGLMSTAIFAFWGEPLTGLFTDDPLVHEAATAYAHVLAASQLFVALEVLFDGVLNGAGDTRTVFWISGPLNALRIPLAYLLALTLGMGAVGVWWAINITTWIKAAIKAWMVWRGRWARTKV